MNGGKCTRKSAIELTSFECDCEGTGYKGTTCERGIVLVSSIPTLSMDVPYMFEVSANPEMEMGVNIVADGALNVYPDTFTLSSSAPTAQVNVTGRRLGQFVMKYTLTGIVADSFNTPENSHVFVEPSGRNDDEINAYFRSVKSEIGYLNESCCMSKFTYSECPMTTEAVSFSSTCSWKVNKNGYATNGIVFARFNSLSVPLSISGIEISYKMGTIDTIVPKTNPCTSCDANKDKLVTENQRLLDGVENCYFYNFQAGDVSDFLSSYALATTYIDRVSSLFPSWIGVQLLNQSMSTASQSISNVDFSTSLVEQEGVSGIKGCENVRVEYPGLYSVLTYSGSHSIQLRINEETRVHQLIEQTVCLAVNLCQEMDSPVYAQLPQTVQDNILKLTVHKPYQEADWTYTLDAVTFYQMKRPVEVGSMYWNGTNMYLPYFPGADMEIRTSASLSFSSFKEGYVRIKAEHLGEHGVLSLDVENADVCICMYVILYIQCFSYRFVMVSSKVD